ncbi:glycosyltransferase family 4 protein [Rosistilla oblonga]|uniref:D-inositol 3-phosphate glycosyltransferase n=1 Tax=Rosistilla oblonga TaxID=2527990 RepID=A0A518ILY5_9BACT|nr:glycosyltransferase family 1 protein [Rosistilla oblonga]QDV54109.1 D-inositol 3-phosphate glycosyltransferase [Rosistilla oblonga]
MNAGRKIIYDSRWISPTGIGRFASELNDRLGCLQHQAIGGSPTSPLDCLRIAWLMWRTDSAFFSPGFNVPLAWPMFAKQPYVFTIHDLIYVNHPAEASLAKRLYCEHVIRPAARRAYKVLTVSEFSKQEIVAWAGIDPSQVEVVYNGVGSAFTVAGPLHQIDHPYVLYVGNQRPHKNVGGLLHAFAKLSDRTEARLAITGTATAETDATIAKLSLGDRVCFLGKLSDDQLAAAYRGAQVTVLASEYEGFGLPVIESMACGTPVVCSNVTSLPEVAGGAAVLVDTDPDSIAEGLLRVLQDESLRDTLAAAGLVRAADFSWEATAAKVQQVLQPLVTAAPVTHSNAVQTLEASAK